VHARYSSKPFLYKATSWKSSLPYKRTAITIFEKFFDREYRENYLDDFWGNQSDEEIDRFIKEMVEQQNLQIHNV
jgi:hypothetical protein